MKKNWKKLYLACGQRVITDVQNAVCRLKSANVLLIRAYTVVIFATARLRLVSITTLIALQVLSILNADSQRRQRNDYAWSIFARVKTVPNKCVIGMPKREGNSELAQRLNGIMNGLEELDRRIAMQLDMLEI